MVQFYGSTLLSRPLKYRSGSMRRQEPTLPSFEVTNNRPDFCRLQAWKPLEKGGSDASEAHQWGLGSDNRRCDRCDWPNSGSDYYELMSPRDIEREKGLRLAEDRALLEISSSQECYCLAPSTGPGGIG